MIRNIFSKIAMLVGVAAIALTACTENQNEFPWDKSDEGATVLEAFGPEVQRNGDMTIIGKNLQNVTAVIFPTDVRVEEFTLVSNDEITVKVPYEAEAGKLQLELKDKTIITSTADIIYVDVFTAPTINMGEGVESVRGGDEISIEGDYLYNVATITFMSGVDVAIDSEAVLEVTRNLIRVAVPNSAITGQIKIADANGINVYSENEVVIRQPEIESVAPTTLKAGEALTIKGKDVDLLESITFAPSVTVTEIEVVDTKSIKVVVPATATAGAVKGTSFAGVETVAPGEISLVAPTELKVAADRFKAGESVTISGKDLDLVTSLVFASGVAAEMSYDVDSKTISTVIPATAVDGAITLSLANGVTVDSEALTLVKAEVTGVAPTELMAGETITVSGNDLDLVKGVKINGMDHEFSLVDGALVITTANTSQSGLITLTQENGVKVEPTESITFSYDSLVIVTAMQSSCSVGDMMTVEGSNFSLIENIFIGGQKVTSYTERTDTNLCFAVPTTVDTGSYPLEFLLFSGDTEYTAQTVEIRGAISEVVIAEGLSHDLGYSWSNAWQLYDGSVFNKVPRAGSTLHVDYTLSTENNYWQIQLNDATWTPLPSFPGNEYNVVELAAGTSSYAHPLTLEDLKALNASGIVIGGCGIIIERVYITYENTSAEPYYISDVMILDYEQHGDHNADWDGSWGVAAEIVKEEGNAYIRTTGTGTGWIMNCNHQANYGDGYFPTVNFDNYNFKLDVKIDGTPDIDPATTALQVVLNGWQWVNAGILPSTTDGKWITITIDCADLNLTGEFDLSTGDLGLAAGTDIGAGVAFDNMRLSLK